MRHERARPMKSMRLRLSRQWGTVLRRRPGILVWCLLLFDVLAHDGVAVEHSTAVFRHKDQMDVYLENTVPSMPNSVVSAHTPEALLRYATTSSIQI